MTKAKAIGEIRIKAERDLTISDGALRLLFRICSYRYVDPKATLEKAFPLPWSVAAIWCGLSDDKSASRRIAELVDAGYLKCDGLRGCPPINHFFLIPNCPSKGAIDCPPRGANDYGLRGANDCPTRGAHHISNSFQEEKIKEKRREFKSSLRSRVTTGDVNGSLRSDGTKGQEKKRLTDAERSSHAHALSRLRCKLASKTGEASNEND